MRAVIMAGGRGLRLHPLTAKTCKPMLHVNQKPMLQTIIEAMVEQCISRITIIVNYKADLIVNHFGNGSAYGIEIDYIRETDPRGTAGSLRAVRHDGAAFVVSNADVLCGIQYYDLLEHHFKCGNPMITVTAALHQQQLRYGVLDCDGAALVGIREKPIESWNVNGGVYIINPECLELIPKSGQFDMTDLINECLANDAGSVGVYMLNSCWFDIGTFEDLSRANGG